MEGIAIDLREMAIEALARAYDELSALQCGFAVKLAESGKDDTFSLDAIPEETIKSAVDHYDRDIVLITEETGKMYSGEIGLEPTQTVLICDPTDRSIKLREFLQKLGKTHPEINEMPVGQVFETYRSQWTKKLGNPAISGASGSITAIRDGTILFNVMINYVTGEIFIADSMGTRKTSIPDRDRGLDPVQLEFSTTTADPRSRDFATFLGKEGYEENMKKCNIGIHAKDCIDPWTGGPMRILHFSELRNKNVSFILSNGEKVCEWIGWLAWVKYAKDPKQSDEPALHAFRLFFESPRTKKLVLVAPAPHYSIFVSKDGEQKIDLERMFQLPDPSHYRETILIAPKENIRAVARVRSLGGHQKEIKL